MLHHGCDEWNVKYDPATGYIDVTAQQANLLDLYNYLARLANNYIVIKARPAPLQTPMTETICTA
jgi:hypothetical protein